MYEMKHDKPHTEHESEFEIMNDIQSSSLMHRVEIRSMGGAPTAFLEVGVQEDLRHNLLSCVGCGWPVLWTNLCL